MRRHGVLVDGSGFIYRAFFAFPALTAADGRSVGAVYGFCALLFPLLTRYRSADFFLIVFDAGRKTFRSELYPAYKATRSETPAELKAQFQLSRDACRAFGIPMAEKIGFEADDLIATYARHLVENGFEVTVASSDKDIMQLIDENVSMFDPVKSKILGSKEVLEKYGVYPSQMVHFQALVGDASDNIPGVKGIGSVTAAKLLDEFQTLDGIYEHMDAIQSKKIRDNLEQGRANAELSRQLATLRKDVDIGDFSAFPAGPMELDHAGAMDFLESLGFVSLINRLPS
jgi:DNA polymerase-1